MGGKFDSAESCRSVKHIPYRISSDRVELGIEIGVAPSVSFFDPSALLKRGEQESGG